MPGKTLDRKRLVSESLSSVAPAMSQDSQNPSSSSGRPVSEAEKIRAYNRFYRDHYDMGYRFLRALRFPYNSLRDILHHCFELAWIRFDEYLSQGKPPYWFYGILKNKGHYEKFRAPNRENPSPIGGEGAIDPADKRFNPEAELLESERKSVFYESLKNLPERYAAVVKLRLNGHDYNAISKLLGISVTNAHARMRRATLKMDEAFADYLKEYPL